ncbi:CheR family methyltransferase [Psychromonas ossibalaenae]|uniref:CheR family methyltransferase n=1 Tax=Psychromonas ossibalaenae TaxID=444922 RepID=UPI00036F765F|nr:CheR family methyltransferase [Psychromonas ossibalaenae]
MGDVREFIFTGKDFAHVQKLIYEHAGISLSPKKEELVYSRLVKRLRFHKISRFSVYLSLLDDPHSSEWEEFINALTTNLTSFFREKHHFEALASHIKRNYSKVSQDQPIKIWCSASSTGEEPYSIAMTMVSLFGCLAPPVKILATDLDTRVLEKARKGIYSIDKIEQLSRLQTEQFFLKGKGAQEGFVLIKPELQRLITFKKLNLLSPEWPMKGQFDVIFCRNVMIYFDKETQYELLAKFAEKLPPRGLLFVGHSESFPNASSVFKLEKHTVYRRV